MRQPLFAFLVIMLVFPSCKKECAYTACTPLPPEPLGIGWNYVYTANSYSAPSFNPNNSNEFCFIKRSSGEISLCTYNMQSKTLIQLYTGNIFYKPDWGISHWILFDVANDIYKIKENGDSLTKLTTGGISCGPKWSPDASEYIYYLFSGLGFNGTLVASPNGVISDSLDFSFGETSAWAGDKLTDGGLNGFFVYNTTTYSQKQINYSIDITSYSGSCFINSSQFIWSDVTGIYLTNIQTNQTIKLKVNCDAISYLFPSYSSLRNKVIWGKTVRSPSGNNLTFTNSIVIMNPDGSDEEEIIIP